MRLALLASLPALALSSLLAPAPAAAQAPGDCACEAPPAPVVVAAAPAPPRWGLGLRMTSVGLHPDGDADAHTDYAGGGLQLRWRVRPRWELELTSESMREQLPDGAGEGDRMLGMVTLAARFHPRPWARWDWYALAGVGVTSEVEDPSSATPERRQAPHVVLGGGVERRFGRIGLGAELRAVGVAPWEEGEDASSDPRTMATVPTQEIEAEDSSGGQLTVAATYYF